MGMTALTCSLPWPRSAPQPSALHQSEAASAPVSAAGHTPTALEARSTAAQRAIFLAGRTVRQMPAAMLNVACNVGFQSAALRTAKALGARAQVALPRVSLAGDTGVAISKELFGELAELVGPRLAMPHSTMRWWPYSRQALIARLTSAIADAGFYTLGVKIGTDASKAIRRAHGVAPGPVVNASQALMEILQDLKNGELVALLGPNGACDWGHRITEAFIVACMPDAKYDFQFCRTPKWKDFFVRFGIGVGVRVAITGVCSSEWLKSIANESQAGYMIAGPYSAIVPAGMRVVQPFLRDVLFQAYLNLAESGSGNHPIDEEAAPAGSPVELNEIDSEDRATHEPVALVNVAASTADAEVQGTNALPPPASVAAASPFPREETALK